MRRARSQRRWTHERPAERVHAVQWRTGQRHPLVTQDPEDPRFYFATVTLSYHSLYGVVETEPHSQMIHDQDYLVTHPDGREEICHPIEFQQRYPRRRSQ